MAAKVRALLCAFVVSSLSVPATAQLVDRTKELRQVDPANEEITLEKRADIYMARKMYREASETYKQALDNQPNSAPLYNKLGISYHQQLMFSTARRHYLRASKLDSDYSQAINNLGTVYYADGSYRKATKTYKQALKIAPYSASVYSNLGTSYFARGKFKDASKAYLTALQLDPEVFESKNSGGTLLHERSVANRAKYYFFMAKAYAQSENHERALLYVRKALEEGFTQRNKIANDSAFAGMLEMPEFRRLVFPEIVASAGGAVSP